MPYIKFETNVDIKDKERLKALFGSLISIIPNKVEARTMVSLRVNKDLYFGGTTEPCAIVHTFVNPNTDHSRDKDYADALIDMVSAELGISDKRIFIPIDETKDWYSRK